MHKTIVAFCLLMLLASHTYAQQYGWSVIASPRPGYQIRAVEFTDSLHGWCAPGELYRTTDGGYTWQQSSQPSFPNQFFDLSFSDTLHGWAVGTFSGEEGLIWRTTDGAQSWSEKLFVDYRRYSGTSARNAQSNTTSGYFHRIGFSSDTGKIAESSNSGTSWTECTVADSISSLGKIQFTDSLHGWITYLSTSSPGVLRTTNGGTSWEAVSTPRGLIGISFVDSLHGWGASYSTPVFNVIKTTDGGISWQITYENVIGDPHAEAISFLDTLNGWLFGSTFYQGDIRSLIMRTSDGGTTWIQESIGIAGQLSDGLMIDAHHGWGVTLNGEVLGYEPVTSVVEHLSEIPSGYVLRQNYPNPFNSSTVIEYEIPRETDVHITVYDGIGKLITTLVNQHQSAGVYRIQFDAKSLSSGVYYYTMDALQFHNTKQLILLK